MSKKSEIRLLKSIRKVFDGDSIHVKVNIKKIDEEQRLVFGEVYAPFIIDTHGDMMLPEDVEKLTHRFNASMKNNNVDVMHNNVLINAVVVESYVNRGDPDYTKGAWVAVTKIFDDDIWDGVKTGIFNGYSMEAMVKKVKALVEVDIAQMGFGIAEIQGDHDHAFFVELDEEGRIIGGRTSKDEDHFHFITLGTATEEEESHKHRFFLPNIEHVVVED